jgi:hypothetical protein
MGRAQGPKNWGKQGGRRERAAVGTRAVREWVV